MAIIPMIMKNSMINRTTDTVTQPQPHPMPFLAPSVKPRSPSPLRENKRPIMPPTNAQVKMNFSIMNKFNTFPHYFNSHAELLSL